MGQGKLKRYRRAVTKAMDAKAMKFFESTMEGLFALSRPKRVLVAMQLIFGRKKWAKGH